MQEVEVLIQQAPSARAALCQLIQWRAGLRISEVINITPADLDTTSDYPSLKVIGKGNKARLVPMHPELITVLSSVLRFLPTTGPLKAAPLVPVDRRSPLNWIKEAYQRAIDADQMPPGKTIGTHTLRHSAARHWLASGVPINAVQMWLGHANLQTTLVYLKILPDVQNHMVRVP